MKRSKVSWSNDVDEISGPCVVCGKEVHFVLPSDRPSPSLLYHPTCDMMPAIREQLKKANPPPLPVEYTVPKAKPAPAAAAPAPTTPATPPQA